MNMNCQPVIFGPGITQHCPAAPWWSLGGVTAANLGWYFLAILGLAVVLYWTSEQVRDRWELTDGRGLCRRWYGTHAQVTRRADAGSDDPARFTVVAWDDEDAGVPWLKVCELDPEYISYWAEGAEPFWAPAAGFAPYAVRRFRPGVTIIRRVPVPWLWKYPVLPFAVRHAHDGRTPEEINTAYYINTASWKRPYDPPGTMAALLAGTRVPR